MPRRGNSTNTATSDFEGCIAHWSRLVRRGVWEVARYGCVCECHTSFWLGQVRCLQMNMNRCTNGAQVGNAGFLLFVGSVQMRTS